MFTFVGKIRSYFNERIAEYFYLFAVFIYSFRMAFRNSLIIQFSSYTKLLIYLVIFALLIPKVLLQKYNRRQLIVSIIIMLLSMTAYYFNRTRNLLAIPLFLIGVKDVDIKRIVKVVFAVTMSFVIIHTAGYFVDHFRNGRTLFNIPLFDRSDNRSTVLCKSFNNYGTVTAMAIMQFVYLFNKLKKNRIVFVALIILSVFFYGIGTSRASLLVSLLSSSVLLLKDNIFVKKNNKTIVFYVFTVCVIISVSMIFMDRGNSITLLLDKLLSGRVLYSIDAREAYGISLWPQVEKLLDNPIYLDNFVVYLIMVYGMVLTALFLLLVIYLANSYGNDTVIDLLMCITYIWALTERYPEYITLTVVPIVVLYEYYKKYEKD